MTTNQALRAYNETHADFPILPNGMFRGQLEGLLTDVNSYLGMSDALLKSLLTMIRCTRPSDWTDPAKEPVCSKMQSDLANQLCKTDRAVRSDEWALEHKFGFLTKHVSANGSRRCVGEDYRQGLIFTPLIELVDDLVALRERMQREGREKRTYKLKCSAFRRHIKAALMELHPLHPDDPELCAVRDCFVAWPRRYTAFKSLDDLRGHYTEAKETAELVDSIRERLLMSYDSSDRAEVNFRRYIQDTTQEPSVFCNAHVNKRTDSKQPDINSPNAEPTGPAKEYLENKRGGADDAHNNEFLSALTPQRLFSLSSEEMQFYISHHQGQRLAPTVLDFIQASIDRLPELGINKSAYNAALDQMNDLAVALCILIIDRNRFHPETPIKNPGGVLRAMTQRQAAGKLNIVGSLIGISVRHGWAGG